MNVSIKVIPHHKQRYRTPGDWVLAGNELRIFVSKLPDWRHEALIAVHELVEVLICVHKGITQDLVDAFDQNYERERDDGFHEPGDEPGDDPSAPYHFAHSAATGVERVLAVALGVRWKTYEDAVLALDRPEVPA